MTSGNSCKTKIARQLPIAVVVYGLFTIAPLGYSAQSTYVPNFSSPQYFAADIKLGRGVAVADMNNDGFNDIVLVSGGHHAGKNYVYFNDGKGNFSDTRSMQFGNAGEAFNNSEDVAVYDLNGDNYPDVLVGISSTRTSTAVNATVESYLYENMGGTALKLAHTFTLDRGGARSAAFTDLDGDGDQDVMLGTVVNGYSSTNKQTILFYQNQGNFNFDSYDIALPKLDTGNNKTLVTVAMTTVDYSGVINGPDRLKYLVVGNRGHWPRLAPDTEDPVTTNSDYHPSAVFKNNSSGAPVLSLQSSFGKYFQTTGVALGDVTGDGRLDIATGHGGEPNARGGMNYVYVNNGTDSYDDNYQSNNIPVGTSAESSRPVAVADINGDGKLDIAVGNQGYHGRPDASYLYYYNADIPQMPYTSKLATELADATYQLRDLELADLNQDGLLDLVGAVSCQRSGSAACSGAFVMLQVKP